MLSTFTPRQHPLHASCIDHITTWDPIRISRQTEEIIYGPNRHFGPPGGHGYPTPPDPAHGGFVPPVGKTTQSPPLTVSHTGINSRRMKI
jgi:hypothetical protein